MVKFLGKTYQELENEVARLQLALDEANELARQMETVSLVAIVAERDKWKRLYEATLWDGSDETTAPNSSTVGNSVTYKIVSNHG